MDFQVLVVVGIDGFVFMDGDKLQFLLCRIETGCKLDSETKKEDKEIAIEVSSQAICS